MSPHINIHGQWWEVEIIDSDRKTKSIRIIVPAWAKMFNDWRIWKVKRKHLKFYAN